MDFFNFGLGTCLGLRVNIGSLFDWLGSGMA